MPTPVPPTTPRDASCADVSAARTATGTTGTSGRVSLFPPRDADTAAYRAWVATSPWPEVVFAAAGHR